MRLAKEYYKDMQPNLHPICLASFYAGKWDNLLKYRITETESTSGRVTPHAMHTRAKQTERAFCTKKAVLPMYIFAMAYTTCLICYR